MKFEAFSAESKNRGRLEPVVVRRARRPDVPALAAIAKERDGGELTDWCRKFEREVESSDACSSQDTPGPLAPPRARTSSGAFSNRQLWVASCREECLALARAAYFTNSAEGSAEGSREESTGAPSGWYLTGIVVRTDCRRRGIGVTLTKHRLEWIRARASEAYYFANARNPASITLHSGLDFQELRRDFSIPGVQFEGGEGILFVLRWPGTGSSPG